MLSYICTAILCCLTWTPACMGHDLGDIVNVTTIDADFGEQYNGTVREGLDFLYVYSYKEATNKTTAVRVTVMSEEAKKGFPLLYVVRQQESILSWQVPLMLDYTYAYTIVSRTLCPASYEQKSTMAGDQVIYVDVSSMSKTDTPYTLRTSLLDDFLLQPEETKAFSVTPSEPRYYMYQFPAGVDSVVVIARSQDTQCAVISIQDVKCPVFDLDTNIKFRGVYQTVTSQAAVTVRREDYTNGSFYVIFVLKPNDLECTSIQEIQTERRKNISLSTRPTIAATQYVSAIMVAVAVFSFFYVAAIVIACFYHACDKNWGIPDLSQGEREQLIRATYPRGNVYGSIPDSLVNSANTTDIEDDTADPDVRFASPNGRSYGTIEDQTAAVRTRELSEVRGSTGAPREPIALQSDDSVDDSSLDTTDIDMLPDADLEKDIIRTKTFLFVSDLARKSRKALSKRYQLYHWNLVTIAIFYGLPVVQLVITYQQVLNTTGDEDICYYNFECAHPLGVLSAFNNVFSNFGYVSLGILFLILVWRRDIIHKKAVQRQDKLEKYYGIPQHFGLFYAMGWALCMEGIMSACYHVCPNYSNFQFDTSFMYVIACLDMLKVYQTRHPDINAAAHSAYLFMAFLIFIAVLGVVYGTKYFWIAFALVHILTTFLLSVQIYYMGRWKLNCGIFKRTFLLLRTDCCSKPMYPSRMVLILFVNMVNWALAIYGLVTKPTDFASYLLAILIVNLMLYVGFYIIMKLLSKERILLLPCLYIISATVLMGFALYFFLQHLTSWQLTPAGSREENRECMLMDFYDSHDVWHMLSAMSLFFSFMILLTLDDDLLFTRRDKIPVF